MIDVMQCPIGAVYYTINQGDTLYSVAQMYNTTIDGILAINPGIDPYNLSIGQVICVYPGLGDSIIAEDSTNIVVGTQEDLNNIMRMLWEQHIVWTRLTIISMIFDLPDVEIVTNRLLRNPRGFEAILRPLYGEAVASRFADLLTNHLTIAAEFVNAAITGDSQGADDAEKRWYANADDLAAFLASINPFWSEEDWRAMLYEHLALTKNEAVDMITGNYQTSANLFDIIEQQALEMADMMTMGIIDQFSHLFME